MKAQALDRSASAMPSAIRCMACRWCFRGYGGCILPRAERLAGEGMARQDQRLRGSIVIPVQSIEKSVAEIERAPRTSVSFRCDAGHGRHALGKRAYWPDLRAAERLGLPSAFTPAAITITRRPRSAGVLSHRGLRRQAQAFQTQLTSVIVEGVFAAASEKLKMVMLESGFTWLPSYLCGCTSSGAACGWKRRGWTARRWKLCAATSGSPCSRSTRRRIRQP